MYGARAPFNRKHRDTARGGDAAIQSPGVNLAHSSDGDRENRGESIDMSISKQNFALQRNLRDL